MGQEGSLNVRNFNESGHGRGRPFAARRGDFGGGGHHGGGGRRARRGNVRAAVLALLSEQPMHGYQMIQELSRRSGGAWTPSPGSIYPTLQMLEDEGLVTSRQSPDGKRLFELTEAGRAEASNARGAAGHRPWEASGHGRGGTPFEFGSDIRDIVVALVYAATNGTDEQRSEIVALLAELRARLRVIVPDVPSVEDFARMWGTGRSGPFGRGWGMPGWMFGAGGGPFGPGGWWGTGPRAESTADPGFGAGAAGDEDEDEGDLDDEGDLEV